MSMFTDVKAFQRAFEQRVGEKPELPSKEERELRKKLLAEEYTEYVVAEYNNDLVEIADALADIIYIACGTAVSMVSHLMLFLKKFMLLTWRS